MRGHDNFRENAILNWAQQAVGRRGLQALHVNGGADPSPAKALCKKANNLPLFYPGSSSSSSVVSNAGL